MTRKLRHGTAASDGLATTRSDPNKNEMVWNGLENRVEEKQPTHPPKSQSVISQLEYLEWPSSSFSQLVKY